MSARARTRERRWRLWQQLPLVLALVPLWMLLWGTVSLLSVGSGIVVALVVTRVFYLPAVELSGRFNPFWFLVFVGSFLLDLVVASFQVAYQALGPRGITSNAVVAAHLETRSDLIMTLTAITMTLVPGSLVLEVDRQASILYLHALNADGPEEAQKVRSRARAVERSLVRALGSKDDVERMCS